MSKSSQILSDWRLRDDVVRLRIFGTDQMYLMERMPDGECLIGTADHCWVRFRCPPGQRPRVLARIIKDEGDWLIVNDGGRGAMRADGARRAEALLLPGVEIGIAEVTLIAESMLWAELRTVLIRVLGWTTPQTPV